MSRYYSKKILIINSYQVEAYFYEKIEFYYNQAYIIITFISIIIRDFLILLTELTLIIIYQKILRSQYELKLKLQANKKATMVRPMDKEYKYIILLICILSFINNFLIIFLKTLIYLDWVNDLYNYTLIFNLFLNCFKNLINFFIFLKFNRRFRAKFFQIINTS